MFVGNIITTIQIDDDYFKIYNDISSIDNSLPTLIIGWKKTKELFGDKVSILHKNIENNLYWTFNKSERKVEYEEDINTFKNICYKKFGDHLSYIYVDPLHSSLRQLKKIIKKIKEISFPYYYISNSNMLYIFGDDLIFGIDLNIIEFIGIDSTKVIDRVDGLKGSTLIGNEIFNKCRLLIKKLNNKTKLVPYIIKNGKYG